MSKLLNKPQEPRIDELAECPKCKANWDGGDIYEQLLLSDYYQGKSDAEIKKAAGMYGWTPKNPKRFSKIIGVELSWDHPNHYEGVSYWECPGCKTTWNRFTNKEEQIPPHK